VRVETSLNRRRGQSPSCWTSSYDTSHKPVYSQLPVCRPTGNYREVEIKNVEHRNYEKPVIGNGSRLWEIDVASAFYKLPPFKSETLLRPTLNGSCSGSLASHDFFNSHNALNRGDNTQSSSAEKYNRYVLACRGSMHHRIPVPSLSLKWLRFDDLRHCFTATNMDSGYMGLQSVVLTRGPCSCQFATAASDQVGVVGSLISDMPVCPGLPLILRSRQPQAILGAP